MVAAYYIIGVVLTGLILSVPTSSIVTRNIDGDIARDRHRICDAFSLDDAECVFGREMVADMANDTVSLEDAFWRWFVSVQGELLQVGVGNVMLFDELAARMRAIDPDLTFEFGPTENGRREFIVSAGGIRGAIPAVESLCDRAPSLDHWKITRFKPRRQPINVLVAGREFKMEETHFELFRDNGKIGILVMFADYDPSQRGLFGTVGYLMLDNALGEYVVATEVGFIEFSDRNNKYFNSSQDMTRLWVEFGEATGRGPDRETTH